MSKTEQLAYELALPFAEQIGCEVIEAEYKKEGGEYYLRIYLDREDGSVSIDDCETVSRKLEAELDRIDPIKEAYYLEVCSPGIDRALKREKDFVRFTGHDVDVKFFAPHDGRKELCGKLASYDNGIVTVEEDNGTKTVFDVKDTAYIKLAVKF